MSATGRAALKAFFETNDIPTQAQYVDLIDSFLNETDDHYLVGGEDTITAHAGGGQADAYQLTKRVNRVTVCANVNDSVKLPAAQSSLFITIRNTGAQICAVYPFLGDEINELGVNAATFIAVNSFRTLSCMDGDTWLFS